MTQINSQKPVRPSRRAGMSGTNTTHKKRSIIGRIYPLRFVALGLVTGLVLSVFVGVYVIYADMMSRVTYENPQSDAFAVIADLTDSETLLGFDSELQALIESGFDQLQDALDLDEDKADSPVPIPTSRPDVQIALKQMPGVENILLFGVDSKAGDYRGRSDVIMIISINHNTRKINLISLMRAMYVKMGNSGNQWNLLNAAYSYGGPNLAVRTVERNFGIPITGFVAVNFNSFVKIIDAIGGVSISLTAPEARALGFSPGFNRLNGRQALAYARLRKIDSDFQRNQRQRNVINSILNEMAAEGGASAYKATTVVLANTYTNLNLNRYISKAGSYLSYGRRQLQIPVMSETRRYFLNNGQEV
ncbi:MAG TPA: LCP family protein, partial [Clostridia bacterium]|nr:LCP family protein [Clostridia bacterium]